MKKLKDFNKAIELLNDFCIKEYDHELDENENFEEIGIAYTTSENGEIEIQCNINLINNDLIVYWNDVEVLKEHFEKDEEFIWFLEDLDFASLTSESGIEFHEEVKSDLKDSVLNTLHELGGCGATDEYTKGWDDAINAAYEAIGSLKY